MKKLLLTTALVALVSPAFAAEKGPTVTLGGSLDTQFGYRQQKTDYRLDNLNSLSTTGNQLSKGGIVNDTKINVKVDGQAHGFKYGGLVSLNADTSANKYGSPTVGYQTMVYGEAKFGRLEAGSYTGAVDSLSVSAANIAKATGGIKGDARYWWNPSIITTAATTATSTVGSALVANTFLVTPSLVSNMDTGNSANAAKVTYYTPKFSGFKVGVSYIPDTEHMGTIANLSSLTKTKSGLGDNQFAFRDVFSGGVMFDHKMNDVTFKASLLGETGTAKDFGGTTVSKRDNLRSWELGASVAFKGFSLAASYGDLGKSGNTKSKVTGTSSVAWKSAKSSYWTVGAAYDYSHFGASVTYLESKRGAAVADTSTAANPKASFKNISFGVDYKVAPGFMPYAEVSAFKLDSKTVKGTKNTGNVFLAGTKLHF